MKLIVICLVFLSFWLNAEARCVFRGTCAEVDGKPKPCPDNDEARPITLGMEEEEAIAAAQMFADLCPTIGTVNGTMKPLDEMLTCCNIDDLNTMRNGLLMAQGILGRCPACMRNFRTQVCELNCSPDQDQFAFVNTSTTDDVTYVNTINYRLHTDFMDGLYDSCSGVVVPQTGMSAIVMMCGNNAVCDVEAWLGFTGDMEQNPIVPVQTNYLRWNTTEDSMHVRAAGCNETFENDLPCSCMDCDIMCPSYDPVVPSMCTVISINCISFSVAITFFVISVTIFTILTIIHYRRLRQSESKPPAPTQPNILIRFFQKLFVQIGLFSVNQPFLTFMITSWICFSMLFGVLNNLNITSDPIELWSGPESRSRIDRDYFNSRFGPFYRASQVFLTFDLDAFEFNNATYGPAFRVEAFEELIKLEDAIINIGRNTSGVTLEEVCFAPTRQRGSEKLLKQCVIQSASIYIGEQRDNINNETYMNNVINCVNNPYGFGCLADWGGGSDPELAIGGYDDDVWKATTLLLTVPIANHLLEEQLKPVLEWEAEFLQLMDDYEHNRSQLNKPDYVTVAYGAERSVQDEIIRISEAEVVPIVISYAIMFVYVVVALGNIRSWKTLFVDSKIVVAIGSFLIVILAIFCALGTISYIGVTISILAINVIPFFVLSVGIDNVFLMINTIQDIQNNFKQYDDYKESMGFNQKRNFVFEKMLTRVGLSMFVSSVTQITCFGIGALSNFPAVQTFAVFASVSLAYLFIFQITTVIALLSLDFKRAFKNRFDLLCCVRKKILDDENPLHSDLPYKSIIQKLLKPYSKFILNWKVRIVVIIIFMAMVSLSTIVIPHIEVGLDQQMALPPDSYVYRYLGAVDNLMVLGPPVFFILKKGLNFTDVNHQNAVCGGQMCNEDSLTMQLFLASRRSEITYLSRGSNSWLDDFSDWTNLPEACCQYNVTNGEFCPSSVSSNDCVWCTINRSEWSNGLRPSPDAFETYIPFFLQDEPTETCNKGGLASYASFVNYVLDSEGHATVEDSSFMAYHSTLSTSPDYINAVKYGYELSENITRAIKENTGVDAEVVPFSVFYVYFEQYLTMWSDTFLSLGFCLIGAAVLNLLVSGFSFTTTFTVMITSIMVVVNVMGIMWLWDIPLNPVSNINLIVAIGIAVEFCSHIAFAYNISTLPPKERVEDAINSVGATIITGITFTNLPIIVLAFAYTEIIQVFFFRMLFSIVVLGLLHGMVFYPVFLSYINDLRFR